MEKPYRQSPRKKIIITLPDEPTPKLGGTISQLALFVVAVNIGACLLAAHVVSQADEAAKETPANIARAHDKPPAKEAVSPAERLAKMLFTR